MQEVSGVYTSPFLHTDERKMALRARKVSGPFEKPAPELIVVLFHLELEFLFVLGRFRVHIAEFFFSNS